MSSKIIVAGCLTLLLTLLSFSAGSAEEANGPTRIEINFAQLNAELALLSDGSHFEFLPEDTWSVALQFRQDERILKSLGVFSDLADSVLSLPSESSDRIQFAALLIEAQSPINTLFRNRLQSLEQRLQVQLRIVAASSGVDQIQGKALASSLDNQRLRYLEAMIDQIKIRSKLNMPIDILVAMATSSLIRHAEELLGALELGRSVSAAMLAQLSSSPDNVDLEAALQTQKQNLSLTARHLDQVVAQLNRLEIDTVNFRKALLSQADSLSVASVDADLVSTLLQELRDAAIVWLETSALNFILQLALFIAIVVLARGLSRFAKRAATRAMTSKSGRMNLLLRDVIVSLIGGAVLVMGVLIAFSQVGISLAPMLAGLGVAGFIVGFALQDTLGNFAAGAMILTYRPFDMGDYIEVAGIEGSVKHMTLVSTTITTVDNKTLIVPNSKIWGDVIRNYTGQRVRRIDLEFGVSYNDDIEHVERILHDVLSQESMVLATPEPMIHLHRLGESSVDFIVRPWVRTEDYWEAYWALMRAVKLRFDAEGISIPFPQRDVHLFSVSTT